MIEPHCPSVRRLTTRQMVTLSLLVAVEVILSRFLSFYITPSIKVSFSFLPVAASGILFGPFGGLVVGALGDLVGALLFPVGSYLPGFTVTAGFSGLLYGLWLHKKQGFTRLLLARLSVLILCSTLLNSVFLKIYYGSAFWAMLLPRLLKNAVQLPADLLLLVGLRKLLARIPVEVIK